MPRRKKDVEPFPVFHITHDRDRRRIAVRGVVDRVTPQFYRFREHCEGITYRDLYILKQYAGVHLTFEAAILDHVAASRRSIESHRQSIEYLEKTITWALSLKESDFKGPTP